MDNKKIILGFTGDLAAGKTTIAKYLKAKYGSESYRFSTMLRGMLNRIYVDNTRENLQLLSSFVRKNFGEDIMSRVIVKDVLNDPSDLVIVEGIRRPTDVTYLKDLDGFHMVYVTAEPKIRWERMTMRGENPDDAKKTLDEFLADEKAEADSLIKEIAKQAEFTIVNDEDIESLHHKVEEILKKLRHEN